MNDTKLKKYNYNLLINYCNEYKIELIKDYKLEKLTGNYIIESKCLTSECGEIIKKSFRSFILYG